MKARILYEQDRPVDGKELQIPASELFIMHMARAFGKFPIVLDKGHIERLEGMCATWTDLPPNPYDVLIREIRRLEYVKVWPSYDEPKP
jgi:hypothetical protein